MSVKGLSHSQQGEGSRTKSEKSVSKEKFPTTKQKSNSTPALHSLPSDESVGVNKLKKPKKKSKKKRAGGKQSTSTSKTKKTNGTKKTKKHKVIKEEEGEDENKISLKEQKKPSKEEMEVLKDEKKTSEEEMKVSKEEKSKLSKGDSKDEVSKDEEDGKPSKSKDSETTDDDDDSSRESTSSDSQESSSTNDLPENVSSSGEQSKSSTEAIKKRKRTISKDKSRKNSLKDKDILKDKKKSSKEKLTTKKEIKKDNDNDNEKPTKSISVDEEEEESSLPSRTRSAISLEISSGGEVKEDEETLSKSLEVKSKRKDVKDKNENGSEGGEKKLSREEAVRSAPTPKKKHSGRKKRPVPPPKGKGSSSHDDNSTSEKKSLSANVVNSETTKNSSLPRKNSIGVAGDGRSRVNGEKNPKKKSRFWDKFFAGRKKKEDKGISAERKPSTSFPKKEPRERQVIYADKVEDLADDLQKKIKKSKLDEEEVRKNFRILLNVLHFLTKDTYRMQGENTPPHRHRRPYASTELMTSAKERLKVPDREVKKLYRKIEFSSKGGFGRVFAAKHVTSKKRVAIKKLPHCTEKDRRNNYCEIGFLYEARHPNIVKILECWLIKEEAWIVTEFLEGGTLSEAVKVHQFSDRHIAYVCREILKALDFLHNINFVHRDLKSGNVMMSIEGHIKLIDFGLCADVSEGSRTQMLGSPYWIPPEMIMKQPHSKPADIWSFAVCVLEMYLKEPPYANCSRLKAMFTAATKGFASCIPDKASKNGRNFLLRCLKIDPAERETPKQLLKHTFVNQNDLHLGIKDVLRGVFVSNSLALSGI